MPRERFGCFAAHLLASSYKPTCTTIMSSSTLLMLPAGSSSSSGMTSASMGTTGGRGSTLHARPATLQGHAHSIAVQSALLVLCPSLDRSEWLAYLRTCHPAA